MSSIIKTSLSNDIKNNLLTIQSVFIQGMKHQDSNGNTCNSVTIQVQTIDKDGNSSIDTLARMFVKYGCGNEYYRRAETLLQNEFNFKCGLFNTYYTDSYVKKSMFHKIKEHQEAIEEGYYTLADY